MPPARIREHKKAPKGTLTHLMKYLFKDYKWPLILCGLCIIFNIIVNLCGSIFINLITQVLTSSIKQGKNPFDFANMFTVNIVGISLETNISILLIILASIYFVGIFASYFWNREMAIITQKFLNQFRQTMFGKMEELPIKYFDTHQRGDIMSLYTNDIDTIRQFISQALPTCFLCGLTALGCIVVMLCTSIWLSLVVICGTVAIFFITKVIGGKASKYFVEQQKSVAKIEGNIEESITGLKVIKVFTHEKESSAEFRQINEELCHNATEANIHGNIMGPIIGNIGHTIYVLCVIVACILYICGGYNLAIGSGLTKITSETFYSMLVTFLMLSRMFTNNVNNFSQQITFIVMGMAGAARCFDLTKEPKEQDDGYVTLVNAVKDKDGNITETDHKTGLYAWKHPHHEGGNITYTELKGDIVLDHVDFSYNGTKMVLHDVSIYAHPGQKIALVGSTGAGKTTITNLINRFYDLADGKARYDGININKIKKDDLRRSLGIVLQDVNLFTGTVMENIRYGRLDATDEEVYEAAKIANAYDFITRLPEGFNTMLAGDGSNLSQGQRQLLSIARAAVANAPVMILDEATSSIDTRTEKLVQDGMNKLMQGRTVFIIAHRLSTIQSADAIMVLDHGKIIERGNHESLLKEKGTYYQLYTGAFELD